MKKKINLLPIQKGVNLLEATKLLSNQINKMELAIILLQTITKINQVGKKI